MQEVMAIDRPEISLAELDEAEQTLVFLDPLVLVRNGFLNIKTKQGQIIPLILNSTQVKVLNKIEELLAEHKPIRLWILKARQSGISTLIEAILFAYTSQHQALNSLVVSHDLDGANYLFSMQKLYYDKLQSNLKNPIKHSNEKKLEFSGIYSQVLVDTSDNLEAGRSYTLRLVHLSEVSRYKDLSALLLSINQAVPQLEGTMIIGETTANGRDQFHDEWKKAESGLSDWIPLFIPWNEIEEYSLALTLGRMYPIEGIKFRTSDGAENFLKEEKVIKEKFNLTDKQLNWRRWAIVNNCNGDILQFSQEFPIDPESAFIASGDIFFDKEALKHQEILKPKVGNIVKEMGRFVFRETETGLFNIYEMPSIYNEYVLTGDTAKGLAHGDKSASVVLNKKSNNVCAVYNHNIAPDRFEEDVERLGHFYNDALVAIENEGYGYAVNQGLYKSYGNVYKKSKTKKGFKETTLEIGFSTNSVTRPTMLAQLKEEIFNGSITLNDKQILDQCWTFINNQKSGRPEADTGKLDDLIMACAIAVYVRREHPYKGNFKRRKVEKEHYRGLAGY
jgi:hypothetical protein